MARIFDLDTLRQRPGRRAAAQESAFMGRQGFRRLPRHAMRELIAKTRKTVVRLDDIRAAINAYQRDDLSRIH